MTLQIVSYPLSRKGAPIRLRTENAISGRVRSNSTAALLAKATAQRRELLVSPKKRSSPARCEHRLRPRAAITSLACVTNPSLFHLHPYDNQGCYEGTHREICVGCISLEFPRIQAHAATQSSAPNRRGAFGLGSSSSCCGRSAASTVLRCLRPKKTALGCFATHPILRGELGRPRWIRRKTSGADAKCYVQLKGVNSSLVKKYWHAATALLGSISASVFSAFTRRNQSAWQTPWPCGVHKSPLITGRPSLSMIVCVGTLSRHSPIP